MDARLQSMADGLHALGYRREWMEYGYTVFAGDSRELNVPLAAFGASQPKDLTTSAIICGSTENGTVPFYLFEAARALAAPAVLVAVNGNLRVWASTSSPEEPPVVEVDATRPFELSRSASFLAPRDLSQAKAGTRQLPLFPIDVSLLSKARIHHAEQLAPRVEGALAHVVQQLALKAPDRPSPARVTTDAARIVMAALAALALADKPEYDIAAPDASPIEALRSAFPRQFSWISSESPQFGTLTDAFETMREGINYRALAPELLADVYEQTVASEADRREFGIHYTPHDLAARLVANIPFETLPPERRSVLDPTCGSGSLLLAAHDRLSRLQTHMGASAAVVHSEVRNALHGRDVDPFAVEVARLSLFLKALPDGDGWDIRAGDALTADSPASEDVGASVGVILSNPPWRKRGWRQDTATSFLQSYVDQAAPDTFLGIVLPATWFHGSSNSGSRESFRDSCEILETWRLPEGVFADAAHATGVVIAQKRRPETKAGSHWLFKRVVSSKKDSLSTFYSQFDGPKIETHLIPRMTTGRKSWLTGAMTLALEGWSGSRLSDVVDVAKGPQPLPKRSRPARTTGTHQYLGAAKDYNAYEVVDPNSLSPVNYPDDFEGRWAETLVEGPKVLAPATRSANNPWRLKVGIAPSSVAVTHSLFMIAPREDAEIDLNAILALLGSVYASAWVDEHAAGRNIPIDVLRAIPVPGPSTWSDLSEMGQNLVNDDSPDPDFLKEIDGFVAESFAIGPSVTEAIVERFSGFAAPEGGTRYRKQAYHERSSAYGAWGYGSVLDVQSDSVRVWVPGVTMDNGDWYPVPARAPGGVCQVGATFSLIGPVDDIDNSTWQYQEFSFDRAETSNGLHVWQ